MSEWKEYKLGDLVTFQRGHDLPRDEMKEGIYPVAGSNSIIGFHNKYTTESVGITIGRSGNIGNPQLHKTNFWAHNTTLYVKEFKIVDPIFFYYLLKTLDFSQLNSGSAVPSLNRNFIHPYKVQIPPDIPTQTAIAEILSSLDDKIELNNKINQELETLAQTLFKRWFIDFEFPNENGDPYKSSGGEMVDSELGEIPKGWHIKFLGEIARVIDCLHSKKPNILDTPTGCLYLQLSNIKDNGLLDLSQSYWISKKDYENWTSRIEVREGDFVITNVGRSGAVSRIPKDVRAAIGRNMTAIRLADEFNFNGYFSTLLISDYMKKEVESKLDSGTILDALNVKNIPKLRFIHPCNIKTLQIFESIVKPLWDKMELNIKENYSLVGIRDTLLPKLISGELEVSQVQTIS